MPRSSQHFMNLEFWIRCSSLLYKMQGTRSSKAKQIMKGNNQGRKEVRFTKTSQKDEVTPVYIRSSEHSWIPALQLKAHPCGTKATVAIPKFRDEEGMLHCAKASQTYGYQENQIISLKDYPNNVLPMQNIDCNGRLQDYMDMVDLPFMHEVSFCCLESPKFLSMLLEAYSTHR